MKAAVQLKSPNGASLLFTFEETDETSAIDKATTLSNAPKSCGKCNSEEVGLTSSRDKSGNVYLKMKCTKCDAECRLGERKLGGYFWHDQWEEGWKPSEPTPF